jgi:hypothetical protein
VSAPAIKGVAFRTVLKLVRAKMGDPVVDSALASLPPELAQALRYEVIASGHYPIAWYRAMWSALLVAAGQGDDFVRQIGRDAIDDDFNVFYRPLLRILSPATLISVGMRHFNQIYDTGKVEVLEPARHSVRLSFTGCVGFNHVMWIEILGSCERLAELTGGKDARSVVIEGGRHDDTHCVAAFSWQ